MSYILTCVCTYTSNGGIEVTSTETDPQGDITYSNRTYISGVYKNNNPSQSLPSNITDNVTYSGNNVTTNYLSKVSTITNGLQSIISCNQSELVCNFSNGAYVPTTSDTPAITEVPSVSATLTVNAVPTNFPHYTFQIGKSVEGLNTMITVYNLLDKNNNSLGYVHLAEVDEVNMSFTITSYSPYPDLNAYPFPTIYYGSPSYNYQNMCIIANMAFADYEFKKTTAISYNNVINGMFALNAYPFNMLTTGSP